MIIGLVQAISLAKEWQTILDAKPDEKLVISGQTLWQAPLVSQIAQRRPVLVITSSRREAEIIAEELTDYLSSQEVGVLPAWETLAHERISPRVDTVAQRMEIFYRLDGRKNTPFKPLKVLVVPVRALLQPIVDNLDVHDPLFLHSGQEIAYDEIIAKLVFIGYKRVDLVGARGEFACRGDILDIFPPTAPSPLRIEFFGDEIEDIRYFSISDQRSLEDKPAYLWVPACKEFIITDQRRQRASKIAILYPQFADILEKAASGIYAEGIESLAALLESQYKNIIDIIADDTLVLATEPWRLHAKAQDLQATSQEFLHAAWQQVAMGKAEVPVSLEKASYLDLTDLQQQVVSNARMSWWEFTPFRSTDDNNSSSIALPGKVLDSYRGNIEKACTDIRNWIAIKQTVLVTVNTIGIAKRMIELFNQAGLAAQMVEDLPRISTEPVVKIVVCRGQSSLQTSSLGIVVLPSKLIIGKGANEQGKMQRLPARRKKAVVDPLSLTPGTLIVHQQHGIGKFIEITTRSSGKGTNVTTREYIVIEYAASKRGQPGDKIWLPTDSLDQISRYIGGQEPAISKIGGADWARTKAKASKAVKEIAAEIVRLYAVRKASKGYAFKPDTPWQHELEESFAYQETPDQLVTIEEVKADMEKPLPMDRIICGDVGYGKTEIAIRAAFKAVMDGKQVAVLVPTTLLASQHYETFSNRYAGFGVNVAVLSRFQSEKASQEIIADIQKGKIDVVIGTHKLITGQVHFKDLGIVIIDEEQRFGVEHKETLTQLRANVDVISLSATPIPRTIEMAVSGIREMSTLSTPPEDRQPILTYVGVYQQPQVVAAIRREILRDGQVFYVHNRVEDIDKVAAQIRDLVPQARIAVAHGKMSEKHLEQVIDEFWQREIDVLVCTTIVETGLDISNANTLIVDRADRMGISQLHQLRGRVGRSTERAYAYFLFPADQPLSETAHERLRTIATHNDLGAGMQVALKDLEIRGAGNFLGAQQSGHIAAVGFDLYIHLISQALTAYKQGTNPDELQTDTVSSMRVDLPVDAHIPTTYIESERLRLELYSKLASLQTDEDFKILQAEVIDRYGKIPKAVDSLFQLARIRNYAWSLGVRELTRQSKYIKIGPISLGTAGTMRIKRIYPGAVQKPAVRQVLLPIPAVEGGSGIRGINIEIAVGEEIMNYLRQFLEDIVEIKSLSSNSIASGVNLS